MIDPLSRRLLVSGEPNGTARAPILLMYHGTPLGVRPRSSYSLSAARLAAQLDLLRDLGWTTVRLSDLARAKALSPKTVALTFDDGYADNYPGAFVPLRERGMCATWFVVTAMLGKHAAWLGTADSETALLTPGQLREMADNGMEIGSHTRTHPDLTVLSSAALNAEIRDSREELRDLLGREIRHFAYPYGRLHEAAIDAVKRAGYDLACSVKPGRFWSEQDRYRLRRVTIFSDDSLATFARKLALAENDVSWRRIAGYTWRRLSQRAPSPR